MAVARIYFDGDVLAERTVTSYAELVDLLQDVPPPQARGGVVTLRSTASRMERNIRLSGHSTSGPIWCNMPN